MTALEVLGVEPSVQTTYETLLTLPASTAAEVAAEGRQRLTEVSASLLRLADLGLAKVAPGSDPPRYVATDPGSALGDLISRSQVALSLAQSAEAEYQRIYHQSQALRDPEHLLEFVTGVEAIDARDQAFARSATTQIRVLDMPPYHPGGNTTVNPAEEEFLARGGQVRVVYSIEGLNLPGRLEAFSRWMASGEEARVRKSLPTKLAIYDHDRALMPLRTTAAPSPTFVVVRPSSLLVALESLFEWLWQTSLPVDPDGYSEPTEPPELDQARELVTLLVAGLPDEAIARRLRLSLRTVHRRLRALMDEYGCKTRFQLALQLARAGVVSVDALDTPDRTAAR